MNSISTMSRVELIDALVASPQATGVSQSPSLYATSGDISIPGHSDDFVRHKLTVAREILLRDLISQMKSGPFFNSPDIVRTWLKLHCATLEHEVFIVLHLDVRHQLIQDEELFRGTLTETNVYPREVVKSALAHNANSVILAHNHPSGIPEPSAADRKITAKLTAALAMVDVKVIDHFIVAGNQLLSFAEQGIL